MKRIGWIIAAVFFLASCQASPTPAPTLTSVSVATATIAPSATAVSTPTSTPVPTATAIPPTLTPASTLVNADFKLPGTFSSFENQFPLSTITQTKGYLLRCVFDFTKFDFDSFKVGNIEIRSWVKCYFHTPDNRVDYVNFPLVIVDWNKHTSFYVLAMETDQTSFENPRLCFGVQTECGFSVLATTRMIPRWQKMMSKNAINIVGLGFGSTLTNKDLTQNFVSPFYTAFGADNFEKFAQTGNTGFLPTFGKVDHFLLAYDYLYDMFK